MRSRLYQVLGTMAREHSLGCDQFFYWDSSDPSMSVAPDAFVKLGVPDMLFDSWKTWERGVPDVAVEIVSGSDAEGAVWEDKLRRYQEIGIGELVRFDPGAPAGRRLRIWDRMKGTLVERPGKGIVVIVKPSVFFGWSSRRSAFPSPFVLRAIRKGTIWC